MNTAAGNINAYNGRSNIDKGTNTDLIDTTDLEQASKSIEQCVVELLGDNNKHNSKGKNVAQLLNGLKEVEKKSDNEQLWAKVKDMVKEKINNLIITGQLERIVEDRATKFLTEMVTSCMVVNDTILWQTDK
jgi:glutamyl/glutaminyl-tRNA synthetase